MLLTLPLGLALNFQVMAGMCNTRVDFWSAFPTSVYACAAAMLPVPGSMAVRMGVLKGHGVTLRRGGGLILLFTAVFGGMGFCFSLPAYAEVSGRNGGQFSSPKQSKFAAEIKKLSDRP